MHEGHFLTHAFESDVFKVMMSVMLFIFACGVLFMLLAPAPRRR